MVRSGCRTCSHFKEIIRFSHWLCVILQFLTEVSGPALLIIYIKERSGSRNDTIHPKLHHMKKTALFDLDGVIIDTEGQYTEFWTRIGRQDFPDNPTFAQDIKGCTLVQIYDKYYRNDAEAQTRVKAELDAFEREMNYPYIEGALDFVDALRRKGYKTAVVTSSNLAKMQALYRHCPTLAEHFDRVFTSEDTPRSKPAPDCYVGAARHFGVEPEECYVFEDSVNGVRAGQASGAYVVGITTTNAREVLQPYCDKVVDSYAELAELAE